MRPLSLSGLLLALSCGRKPQPSPCEDPAVPTWHSFAQGYVRTWCVGCHTASLTGAERQGAPEGLDFDTWSEVHEARDRITARATGESPDMPPLGGIAREQVDLFAQWLSCGATGRDDPPDPCSALVDVGDRAISSQADADALCAEGNAAGLLSVAGSAEISCLCSARGLSLSGGELSAPSLQRIDGDLLVTGASRSLSLPSLREITGSMGLSGSMEEISLPSLSEVGGELLSQESEIVDLSLPALYSVGGSLRVMRSAHAKISVPRLKSVGGDMILEDLPSLVLLDGTRSLEIVGGSLVLRRLPRLPVLDDWAFLLLSSVGGDVIVSESAEIVAIHGLTLLASVPGDLLLEDLPSLVRIEGLDNLTVVSGDLSIARNTSQVSVYGLVNLESVQGELSFEDLPSVQSLAGLEALRSLGGLSIERTSLPVVGQWPLLESISGPVTIIDNEALSTDQIGQWLGGISVDGPITVEGNAQ